MELAALLLYVLWAALAFGLRAAIQVRRTGDTGFRGFSGEALSAEWWAGVCFAAAIVAGLLAPVAGLAGWLEPVDVLSADGFGVVGVGLSLVGILGTLLAQLGMGDSWRVGVDPKEQTELVTQNAFGLVRNPIFTAMLFTGIGLALMVPNVLAIAGAVGLVVGLELQVRLVEEPYLLVTHGAAYRRYAAQVGRFVPGLGRIGRDVTS